MNIVMAAYGLDYSAIQNFMDWNREVFEKNHVTVWVGYHEKVETQDPMLNIIHYPFQEEVFSIGRTVNYVIRRVRGCPEAGRIIKTDPDIMFSDEVLKHVSRNVKIGHGMICICSNVANVELVKNTRWKAAVKRKGGKGACFAMTKRDWADLNGYDERIEGWGGDDEEMHRRAIRKVKINLNWLHPLYHINHPQRKNSGNFPVRSVENSGHMIKNDWSSDNWGKPNYSDIV